MSCDVAVGPGVSALLEFGEATSEGHTEDDELEMLGLDLQARDDLMMHKIMEHPAASRFAMQARDDMALHKVMGNRLRKKIVAPAPDTAKGGARNVPRPFFGGRCVPAKLDQRWIAGYESIETRLYDNTTALMKEVRHRDQFGISCCAARGVDLDCTFLDGRGPALVEAASQSDVDFVQRLLELRADAAKGNLAGVTPLMAAAAAGAVPVVSLLLEQLPQVAMQAKSKSGHTAGSLAQRGLSKAMQDRQEASQEFRKGVSSYRGARWDALKAALQDADRRANNFQDIQDQIREAISSPLRARSDDTARIQKAPQAQYLTTATQTRGPGRWWLAVIEPEKR